MAPALQMVAAKPVLADLVRQGRMLLWGRVEPEALPEVYSRSTVTVMPSRYEPFGIVGLQAMACGSPLIASAVGGLQHVVVHKYTGYAVPPDDPVALAWAISGFLRPDGQRRPLSRNGEIWARNFSMERLAARFRELYQGRDPRPFQPFGDPRASIMEAFLDSRGGTARLGTPVRAFHLHTVEWLETPRGPRLRKVIDSWPTPDASMFDLPASLRPPGDREHMARVLFHRDAPWAVPLESADTEAFTLTFPVLQCAGLGADELSCLKGIIGAMGCHRPVAPSAASAIHCAWKRLESSRSQADLDAFDVLAAGLQHPVLGASDVFQRVHPGAELVRLILHAEGGAWPLDQEQQERVSAVCRRGLDILPQTLPPPRLCHGDLKRRHVLKIDEGLVLCDFEETRYAVGSLDEALWMTYEVALSATDDAAGLTLRQVGSIFDDEAERSTCLAWCVSSLLYRGLWCAMRGEVPTLDRCLLLAEGLIDRRV